jgi:hypothetical protein
MTTHTHDELTEAFADPALAALLAELEAVAAQPPPAVGAELAAVLAGAVPLAAGRPRRSRAASFAVITLLSGGVVAGGVGAAAADELPAPVQRVVSRVVSTLTPFEVPHPDRAPRTPDPGPVRPSRPVPVAPDDRDAGEPAEAPDTTELPSAEPDDPATGPEDGTPEGSEEVSEDADGSDERDAGSDPDRESSTDDDHSDGGGTDREDESSDGGEQRDRDDDGGADEGEHDADDSGTEHDD